MTYRGALRFVYCASAAAQVFWLVRIFIWQPQIADSYRYAIEIAGYAFFGLLVSIGTLILAISTRSRRNVQLKILAATVAVVIWAGLFLLAGVAV